MPPKSSRSRFTQPRRRRVTQNATERASGTAEGSEEAASAWAAAAVDHATFKPSAASRRAFFAQLAWQTVLISFLLFPLARYPLIHTYVLHSLCYSFIALVHIRVHSLSTHTHFVSPMYLPRVALLHMLHGALLAHVHMYAMPDSILVTSL